MTRTLVKAARRVFALGLLMPSLAFALNMQFLGQAPLAFANSEDEAIFGSHFDALLDSGEPGEVSSWKNPNTGAKGTMQLIDRFEHESRPCARVLVQNEAGGRTGGGVLTSCRLDTGEWRWVVLPES